MTSSEFEPGMPEARKLFEWYPIRRLEGMRSRYEPGEIRGWGSPQTLRRRTYWVAIVRRVVGRDGWTGLPLWSEPEDVDLTGVQDEMERLSPGGQVFSYNLTDVDPTERVRNHINAAAETLANRTRVDPGWPL